MPIYYILCGIRRKFWGTSPAHNRPAYQSTRATQESGTCSVICLLLWTCVLALVFVYVFVINKNKIQYIWVFDTYARSRKTRLTWSDNEWITSLPHWQSMSTIDNSFKCAKMHVGLGQVANKRRNIQKSYGERGGQGLESEGVWEKGREGGGSGEGSLGEGSLGDGRVWEKEKRVCRGEEGREKE